MANMSDEEFSDGDEREEEEQTSLQQQFLAETTGEISATVRIIPPEPPEASLGQTSSNLWLPSLLEGNTNDLCSKWKYRSWHLVVMATLWQV